MTIYDLFLPQSLMVWARAFRSTIYSELIRGPLRGWDAPSLLNAHARLVRRPSFRGRARHIPETLREENVDPKQDSCYSSHTLLISL